MKEARALSMFGLVLAMLSLFAGTSAAQSFSDDFESYAEGTNVYDSGANWAVMEWGGPVVVSAVMSHAGIKSATNGPQDRAGAEHVFGTPQTDVTVTAWLW